MIKKPRFIFYILVTAGVLISTLLVTGLVRNATSSGKLHEALYWRKLPDRAVQCELCPRRCVLKPGQRGQCKVRENKDGKLYSLVYGKPCAVHIDPIEKKPFFHVAPSSSVFSIATVGCNLRCIFCQNWQISQTSPEETRYYDMEPAQTVDALTKSDSRIIAYTYTEPTVFYEYMLDTARLIKQQGFFNTMHSCGYINPAPLKELLKYMDAINIDLKGFNEKFYRKMSSGRLEPVLETLKTIKQEGVWLEITNLIIPGANDDPEDIRKMCEWIKENLGEDTPLHFGRFFPNYKLMNLPPTPTETLERSRQIALRAGLKYVYIGNLPGNPAENTHCPKCEELLVKRVGYIVEENNIIDSKCKFCNYKIAGRWDMLE